MRWSRAATSSSCSTISRPGGARRSSTCSDAPQLELIEGSTLDQTLVDELVASTDATLHLASAVGVQLIVSSPLSSLLGNVRGTDNVFASAVRHGKRLLFTSTSEVYGKNSAGPLSEDADRILGSAFKSRWAYAMAKGFGEALAHGYYRDCQAEVIVARLFNTVGPAPDRRLRHGPPALRAPGARRRGSDRVRQRDADALLHARRRHGAGAAAAARQRRRRSVSSTTSARRPRSR